MKTTMGDGEIVSTERRLDRYYLVKFSFGVGQVPTNAILEAAPLDDAHLAVESIQPSSMQQDDTQTIFGTKNVYIFLRLYTFLASVMAKFDEDVRDPHFNVLMGLAAKKEDYKEFEAQCRTRVKSPRLHIFLNIPFLVERCTEAFAQLQKEDVFIKLSHLSQLQLKVS